MATNEERRFDTRDFDESPAPDDSDSEGEEDETVIEEEELAGEEDEAETGEDNGTNDDSTDSTLMDRVLKLLETMEVLDVSPADLLIALSWGDNACNRHGKIRAVRRELLCSPHLPGVIRRWWKPPRLNAKKRRPDGATALVDVRC
ncbi:hypothetical protein NLJ89_g11242 [Agrocybe chaxingu]|uniref:Uncharacterized protein n=1 Tax=Agrocybe chaxingu TaxID=84603 RepID=A0A9W8JM90_9AGAR|nr:hypothetical protein NLJ89_g11242 [Agrocybe chaxingu]